VEALMHALLAVAASDLSRALYKALRFVPRTFTSAASARI